MVRGFRKRGFTLVELLVVIMIVVALIAMLLPAIQADRGNRRTQCVNNMKQIGIAMHNYHSIWNQFPGSGQIVARSSGGSKVVGGWSFLVNILPYMELNNLYTSLQINGFDPSNPPPGSASATAAQQATATLIPTFVCEKNPNSKFQDPATKQFALTSYKAMGATCMGSLQQVTTGGTSSQSGYLGLKNIHPDGAMFPGKGIRMSDIEDGTSHTILCAETIDNTQSVWTMGADATMVGLPDTITSSGVSGAVSFAQLKLSGGTDSYYAPAGFAGAFDQNGNATNTTEKYSTYRTFLQFDFSPTGVDRGTYPQFKTGNAFSGVTGQDGTKIAETMVNSNTPAYGPSSGHPSVVNHLMGDASVHSLSKQIDVTAYMFIITRNGGEPNPALP